MANFSWFLVKGLFRPNSGLFLKKCSAAYFLKNEVAYLWFIVSCTVYLLWWNLIIADMNRRLLLPAGEGDAFVIWSIAHIQNAHCNPTDLQKAWLLAVAWSKPCYTFLWRHRVLAVFWSGSGPKGVLTAERFGWFHQQCPWWLNLNLVLHCTITQLLSEQAGCKSVSSSPTLNPCACNHSKHKPSLGPSVCLWRQLRAWTELYKECVC